MSDFKNYFRDDTNLELVWHFNQEVKNKSWVSSKGYFLAELKREFKLRRIDYTLVSNNSGGFNLHKKVKLLDNKLIHG